jgi:cyclophilin family peptidyl-prolyl cis-trans isomerase
MKILQGRVLTFGFVFIGLMVVTACVSASIETDAPPPAPPPTEPPAAPLDVDEGAAPLRWSSPPAMEIDPAKSYEAVFVTEIGDFKVRLYADQAPVTVNNFVFLANQGYYDNTTFHRVLSGFMAQGGDPTGTGGGDPGYMFEDEFDSDLQFDRAGLLAMANRGPNTNGGQFFCTDTSPQRLSHYLWRSRRRCRCPQQPEAARSTGQSRLPGRWSAYSRDHRGR